MPLLLLTMTACFSRFLEAPYVLAAGLGDVTSMAPYPNRDALLIGSREGLWEVTGEGAMRHLDERPVVAVTTHPERIWVRTGDALLTASPDAASLDLTAWGSLPETRALVAWYDDRLLLATETGLETLDPASAARASWADVPGVRALALSPRERCVFALTDREAWELCPSHRTRLAEDLSDPRAITGDGLGRVWLIHGDPPELFLLDAHTPTARYLGDPVAAQVGLGTLIARDRLYLADRDGSVDYLPLPSP